MGCRESVLRSFSLYEGENLAIISSFTRRESYTPIHHSDHTIKKRVIMSMSVEECSGVRDGFPRPFPNTPANVLQQMRMDGKVVVVTGGADGIGYAVAEGIAEAGGNVALWYNSWVTFLPISTMHH